ncbi:MAG: hypothetical protein IJG57_01410 [Firmicutes bacterium]|nr:hypothetical protein [Bacillota bacterium]
MLVFLIGEAVVFAGSFAGHPLLKWFQVPNVSKPGEEELELAREGIRRLVERKTDQG